MLWEQLIDAGAVKFGEFTLTSGKKSDYYVDIKEAMADPLMLGQTAVMLAKEVESEFIAGVELGAVPLVVAASLMTKKPYIIIRKERSHGTGSLFVGKPVPGKTVDIIEDVVTTGGSVAKAVEKLREAGMKVGKIIYVVDRQEGGEERFANLGVKAVPLFKIRDMMKKR